MFVSEVNLLVPIRFARLYPPYLDLAAIPKVVMGYPFYGKPGSK